MTLDSLALAFAAKGLRPRSKLVLILLTHRGEYDDLSWSDACQLADSANITFMSLIAAVDELIEHGYLPDGFSIGSPE